MNPKLIVITGVSRSGKDTLASEFAALGYRSVSMAIGMKETIERLYGLPQGSMELDSYRNARILGTPYTYLDMMVKLAGTWRDIDPDCMTRYYSSILRETQVNTVTTGVRFLNEARLFSGTLSRFYDVSAIYVNRGSAVPLESDNEIQQVRMKLEWTLDQGYQEIQNNSTLEDYKTLCKTLAKEIHEKPTH